MSVDRFDGNLDLFDFAAVGDGSELDDCVKRHFQVRQVVWREKPIVNTALFVNWSALVNTGQHWSTLGPQPTSDYNVL